VADGNSSRVSYLKPTSTNLIFPQTSSIVPPACRSTFARFLRILRPFAADTQAFLKSSESDRPWLMPSDEDDRHHPEHNVPRLVSLLQAFDDEPEPK
jgi:hypothetical protein